MIGSNQKDYKTYVAFFKDNYKKGIHNLSTLLGTPDAAEELIENVNALAVIFGVSYLNKDNNSDKLFDLLMSSPYADTALDNWLLYKYNTSLYMLATGTGDSDYTITVNDATRAATYDELREIVVLDAANLRNVCATEYLQYFIDDIKLYDSAVLALVNDSLCLYRLLSDTTSFNTIFSDRHNAFITADVDILCQALLKFIGKDNLNNTLIDDTTIRSFNDFLMNQECMNAACNNYASLMTLVAMIAARAAYSDEGQTILNNAMRRTDLTGAAASSHNNIVDSITAMQRQMNYILANDHLWEAFFNSSSVGSGLNTLYSLGLNAGAYRTIDSIMTDNSVLATLIAADATVLTNILRSETAINSIANSTNAINAFIASADAMAIIANSEKAMKIFANNTTVMTAFVGSQTAMDAITASKIAMDIIADNQSAMDIFINNQLTNNYAISTVLTQATNGNLTAVRSLNTHKIALQHLTDTYLTSIVVCQDICSSETSLKLIADNNDIATIAFANADLSAAIYNSEYAMVKLLTRYAELDITKYSTYAELYGSRENIEAIINHTKSHDLLYSSNGALLELFNNQYLEDGVYTDAINVILQNDNAFEELLLNNDVMTVISGDDDAITLLANTILSKTEFIEKVMNSDAVLEAFNDNTDIVTMINVNTLALSAIGHSATGLTLSNYTPDSSNIAILENENICAYLCGIIDAPISVYKSCQYLAADLTTMEDLVASENAMTAIANNIDAVRIFFSNTISVDYIFNSEYLDVILDNADNIDALVNTPSILETVLSSTTAMDIITDNATLLAEFLASPMACYKIGGSQKSRSYANLATTSANTAALNDTNITAYACGCANIALFDSLNELFNNPAALQIVFTSSVACEALFNNINGINAVIANLSSLVGNKTVMNFIANSTSLMTVIAANADAMATITASPTAMEAIASSSVAMEIISNSATAMTAINNSSTARAACNGSSVAMWIIGNSNTARSASNYMPTSNNVIGLSSSSHAAYVQGIIDSTNIGDWSIVVANSTYMAAIASNATAMSAVAASYTAMNAIIETPAAMTAIASSPTAMAAIAASPTAMSAIAANASAMAIIAASSTAMDAIAASSTAMNAVVSSTIAMDAIAASNVAMTSIDASATAVNAVLGSRIAMYYLGKYNSNTTNKTNFATTHANLIGLNDSLMSAYLAGWLGAASYDAYTDIAGILSNSSYLTVLGGSDVLMTLMNANTAACNSIANNLMTSFNTGNTTFLNAVGAKANIMSAVFSNASACTLIANNIAITLAASTFWGQCCTNVDLMNTITANSTAMETIANNSNAMATLSTNTIAMTAINDHTTAINACNASTVAMWAIGKSAIARAVANYAPGSSNIAALASGPHAAYIAGIINQPYIGDWSVQASNSTYMEAIVDNADAMTAIVNSIIAINAITTNSAAMIAVNSNATAVNICNSSPTIMNAIGKSSAAIAVSNYMPDSSNVAGLTDASSAAYVSGLVNRNALASWVAIAANTDYMTAIAANSNACSAMASNSSAMNAIDDNSTACTICNASTTAMWAIGNSSTARAVSNYTTTCSNVTGLASGPHAAYVCGIANTSYGGDWSATAASSTAMAVISTNATAMEAAAASSTAMSAVAASSTAMSAVVASSTAMSAVAASSTAMSAVNSSSTAISACNASTTAMHIIGASSTARAVSNYTPTCSNVTSLASGPHAAYVCGICNLTDKTNWTEVASDSSYMTTIAGNATAMSAVAASSTARSICQNNNTALSALMNSGMALKIICSSETWATEIKSVIQAQRNTMITTLNTATSLFTKSSTTEGWSKYNGSGKFAFQTNTNTIFFPTSCYDDGDTTYTCYYGTDGSTSIYSLGSHSSTTTVSSGVSLRGVYTNHSGGSVGYVTYDYYTVI